MDGRSRQPRRHPEPRRQDPRRRCALRPGRTMVDRGVRLLRPRGDRGPRTPVAPEGRTPVAPEGR
ncbi:hypothetical protein SGPA1_11474 [Streptomyces misionensis JCM 4497]